MFIGMGLLLIAAAFCLTAYNFWDSARAGKASDKVLSRLSAAVEENKKANEYNSPDDEPENAVVPEYILNPKMEMPAVEIDRERYIGMLTLKSQNKVFPVFDEWNYDNLKTAPCRYSGTAYQNNLVICAHNYTVHFGTIGNLKYGDEILFTDCDGNTFSYEVVECEELGSTSVDKMTSGEWDLTLFTCTLSGRSRVTVRCQRKKQ